jgi:predicted RNA-binding protein with EMAP domain
VSLCAADPSAIVVTYVAGELNGLSGHPAADHLLELVLTQGEVATTVAL